MSSAVDAIPARIIEIVAMGSDPEKSTFIELAAYLDEGEAMTGAIALHHGWTIATDDRKAIRIYRDASPGIGLITTPELVQAWADERNPGSEVLAQTLRDIRMRARYEPDANHPLADWWRKSTAG